MLIYMAIKTEAESSKNGSKPHSAWRNYDEINKYVWSKWVLKSLNCTSNFFDSTPKSSIVGKTWFVEQRSFWNAFGSFDRLWILWVFTCKLVLRLLQVMLSFHGKTRMWMLCYWLFWSSGWQEALWKFIMIEQQSLLSVANLLWPWSESLNVKFCSFCASSDRSAAMIQMK